MVGLAVDQPGQALLGPRVDADHPAPNHDEHDYDADQVVGLDVEQLGKAQLGPTDTADHPAQSHEHDADCRRQGWLKSSRVRQHLAN